MHQHNAALMENLLQILNIFKNIHIEEYFTHS